MITYNHDISSFNAFMAYSFLVNWRPMPRQKSSLETSMGEVVFILPYWVGLPPA